MTSEHGGPLRNRQEAGRELAERLLRFREEAPFVLALPRGGVPVAAEIASHLHAPFDVLIVRKVGAPGNPEYGLGAVGEGGVLFLDRARVRDAGLRPEDLEPTIRQERDEVARRVERFRGGRSLPELAGRTVILVDDGVATGGTVIAGIRVLRAGKVGRVVVALGVCPPETLVPLRKEADEVVCLRVPDAFFAVGEWYRDFAPVDDDEVDRSLARRR
jgi:putative phosphoribosyl transferase